MIEKLLQEIRQTSDALLTDGTLQSEQGCRTPCPQGFLRIGTTDQSFPKSKPRSD